jgi:hypothetical protein
MVHACSSTYSGDRGQEDHDSKLTQANSLPYLENTQHQKGMVEGLNGNYDSKH